MPVSKGRAKPKEKWRSMEAMQTGTESKLSDIGKMIIEGARSDLYVSMRYLDLAIFALVPFEDGKIEFMGTDGDRLFFSPEDLLIEYKKDRKQINRGVLHSIFHCLFRHLYNAYKYSEEDSIYWDIACDIAVEYLIDDIKVSAVNTIVSRYRTYIYKRLSLEMDILTAEGIYKSLKEWDISDSDFKIMYKVFRTDDHGYWNRQNKEKTPPPIEGKNNNDGNDPPHDDGPQSPDGIANAKRKKDKWEDLSRRTMSQAEQLNKGASEEEKNVLAHLKAANRRRYDYKEFLRRFAVYGEVAKPDPESFDMMFYTYGLELYGNMPIIEPNEYREAKRISDFVIVIDTSASCSGDAVQGFLDQTFSILKLRESFFDRVNIHVIQCDNKVRRDTVIKSPEDIDRLVSELDVEGFGGTDFRPAFEYVENIKDVLPNMKGLIYFTDGEGVFPSKPPEYETAFVFLKEHWYDAEVPPWAVKLILDIDDIKSDKGV